VAAATQKDAVKTPSSQQQHQPPPTTVAGDHCFYVWPDWRREDFQFWFLHRPTAAEKKKKAAAAAAAREKEAAAELEQQQSAKVRAEFMVYTRGSLINYRFLMASNINFRTLE
jgi:hypothetical protein